MHKQNVLIITYYWPPAGGPGVQRWLKFVKYLSEFGINPVVYCPENPHYPIIDSSLQNEVLKDITILKQPIKEPYALANLFSKKSTKNLSSGVIPNSKKQTFIQRLLLFVRGNFFIPDARKNWVKPSVKLLLKYIENHTINTIITTGPPHSMHLIGLQLQQKLGVTWFADFRDPWTTIGYHKVLKLTKAAAKKHLNLEHKVLNAANHIIVTSNHTKQEFETKTKQPITVITNGYDVVNRSEVKKDEAFTIAHIGSLLSDRNPTILWQAISELIIENEDFSKAFQLNLVGVVSNEVLDTIYSYGLKEKTNVFGYVNHDTAVAYQQKSQVLLLLEINSEDTKAIIPGKLFEYLVSKTPILAIGPEDSDVEAIITTTKTGYYFSYTEKEAIKTQLLNYFEAYKNNTLKVVPQQVKHYSRRHLTKTLATLINKEST